MSWSVYYKGTVKAITEKVLETNNTSPEWPEAKTLILEKLSKYDPSKLVSVKGQGSEWDGHLDMSLKVDALVVLGVVPEPVVVNPAPTTTVEPSTLLEAKPLAPLPDVSTSSSTTTPQAPAT